LRKLRSLYEHHQFVLLGCVALSDTDWPPATTVGDYVSGFLGLAEGNAWNMNAFDVRYTEHLSGSSLTASYEANQTGK
jgi:hypothetical protein